MAPAKRNAVPSDAPRRRSERTSTKRSSAAGELSHDAPHIDVVDDEDEEATSSAMADQWLFDIKAKLDSPTFDHPDLIQKLDPKYFNLEFVKQTGLVKPLFFDAPPTELGMKMPNAQRFGVNEVKKLVTPEREIEVVVVKTQTSRKMTMNEFANYYKKKAAQRKNLLNVLSLEFSMTPLEQKVRAPELIKSIDWVELYWPKALRKRQEYLTNPPADVSTYPKVQNYCLMSVSDCYTDFHIDFGGTSVWYHVLKGEKIFFMIEPTEQNIKVYEGWTLSGSDQNKTFFGDIVVKCARVRLVAGNTFVIPS
uniref:JmjC domain-containing protein n=1 Tax=Plectus sambesii TaxID=2011161 RepID=A0A914XG64_9BILA